MMCKLSESIERKFVDHIELDDEWEIETDSGWQPITHLYKTIEYDEWILTLENDYELICADTHIVFDDKLNEIFVKDLNPGDFVSTDAGFIKVKSIVKTDVSSNMFDITVDSPDRRFYTNGILSHNTTTAVALLLHYVLFNEHKTAVILANKGDASKEVLSRIKLAYESLPKWLQQGILEWNKQSIELENGCKIFAGTTSSSSIRGKSISYLYIDECIGENTKCCIEIKDRYYYTEIKNCINIDESKLINIRNNSVLYSIYKTTNKINNKEYIGFHSVEDKNNILCKKTENGSVFLDGYMGSGKLIRRALEKYGPENMRQEILYLTNDRQDAYDMERMLVNKEYILREDTYNLSIGGNICILHGKNNGFYGKKHSQKTLDQIVKNRSETYNKNPFSWCETYDIKTNTKFITYREVYNFYKIEKRTRFSVYELVYNNILKFKSDYLQEIALKCHLEKIEWDAGYSDRQKIKSEKTSKRFKGVPKTAESNIKRGNSIKDWIKLNPELHLDRMNKINKNPEKIKKTAEKHIGMKRSEQTCKNISDSLKGKAPYNKNKIHIKNNETGETRVFDITETIPEGWSRGYTKSCGPKGKKIFHNKITNEMKYFIPGEEPIGWSIGRL